MITIRIAGINVGLDSDTQYLKRICRSFLSDADPDFTVSVKPDDVMSELGLSTTPSSYEKSESTCLYREICRKMPEYDCFLMHSAAIAVNGKAIAFAAKSGVGKTTHIRLWADLLGKDRVQPINGDKPLYRFIDGTLFACSTPFMGKEQIGSNRMAPLRTLCFIERSETNRIRPLEPTEIIARLTTQLLFPKEPEAMERFIGLVDRMVSTIPCYLLSCNKDITAAQTAYDTTIKQHLGD